MSLKSVLNGKNEYDKEFQRIIREIIPKKVDFKTLSGKAAFSNEYSSIVKYQLSKSTNSAIIGTAFDYLARVLTYRYIDFTNKRALDGLIAKRGLENLERFIIKDNSRAKRILNKSYKKGIASMLKFIKGKKEVEEIISAACLFAKLELYQRSAYPPTEIENYLIRNHNDEEVIMDLIKLCKVYEERFLVRSVISPSSTVIANPSFGIGSALVGGADADIIIDNTLYDFKTTNKNGYNWKEIAQVFSYALFHNIAKRCEEPLYLYKEIEINRIALYHGRFGEIEYFDLNNIDKETLRKAENEIIKNQLKNPSVVVNLTRNNIDIKRLKFTEYVKR